MERETLPESMDYLYHVMEKEGRYDLHVHYIRQRHVGQKRLAANICRCLKDMATARFVFLCEGNRFVSCISPRKETMIVQLWHGCGAFKRFGFSTAQYRFGGSRREYVKYPYYKNYDYVTVSSPSVAWAYREAMNLSEESGVIRPIGVSRTDVYFQEKFLEDCRQKIQKAYPWIQGRRILLYAPTFRGQVGTAAAPAGPDIAQMAEKLSDRYVLLIKQHPLVKERPALSREYQNFAADVSEEQSIETLLCVSDICISDYSSLVFEYSLFERPMIFFACDLEEYEDWRGFYYDYQELTPGPVLRTTEQLVDYILHIEERFDAECVKKFREKFMSACDGHATERLLKLLENGEK